MPKFSENIYFWNKLLFFFLTHFAIIELFPDKNFTIWNSFDFWDSSKRTFSDVRYLLIILH